MAQHVRELFIHGYKGIHELKLEQLNSINILTDAGFRRRNVSDEQLEEN